jgi:hypothetical protein
MAQIPKTIISEDIMDLLDTLHEQFETLETFEGKIPILEFEILKDNVRKLYDKLLLLQKLNEKTGTAGKEKPVQAESVYEEPAQIELPLPGPHVVKEPDILKPGESKTPELKQETGNMDLFSTTTSAFAEKLKEAREQTVGPRSNQPRTGDIKSIININDKFLFINELFDGDYKEYTRTIETFNTFAEKGEAFDYLDSLLKDNLWNSTSAAFLKLKEIVEKRFG